MTSITKLISIALLVVFFSLLSVGIVTDMQSEMLNGSDCMGVNCGPVTHMIYHVFLIPKMQNVIAVSGPVTVAEEKNYSYEDIHLTPLTPPPNSLS